MDVRCARPRLLLPAATATADPRRNTGPHGHPGQEVNGVSPLPVLVHSRAHPPLPTRVRPFPSIFSSAHFPQQARKLTFHTSMAKFVLPFQTNFAIVCADALIPCRIRAPNENNNRNHEKNRYPRPRRRRRSRGFLPTATATADAPSCHRSRSRDRHEGW